MVFWITSRMKTKREQVNEEIGVIKLFVSNYAKDLIYKSNHPITPKDVVNVHDLRYLGVEKDFPTEQLLHYRIKRNKSKRIVTTRKRLQQTAIWIENRDREYHHL